MPLVPMVGLLICFLGMVWLGFLSFQGSVYVHLCLGVLGSISPNYCYLPASCCDGISNLICQAIYHLQSALHPFSNVTSPPLIHLVRGLFYCLLPILQLRLLGPREVAQGHTAAEQDWNPGP